MGLLASSGDRDGVLLLDHLACVSHSTAAAGRAGAGGVFGSWLSKAPWALHAGSHCPHLSADRRRRGDAARACRPGLRLRFPSLSGADLACGRALGSPGARASSPRRVCGGDRRGGARAVGMGTSPGAARAAVSFRSRGGDRPLPGQPGDRGDLHLARVGDDDPPLFSRRGAACQSRRALLDRPSVATASDFLSLTKPRLSSLVLVTTAGGMWLSPSGLSPARQIASLLAVAGLVGGANALNCFIERDVDRLMARTRNRPLPAGRMDPQVALWFGILLAAVSLPTLFFEANAITALLGCIAFFTYVFVYTPLKSRSYLAMLVGAVPGALPPLMGWTAANGTIGGPGLVLFAILFLWQLPHFIAISLYRRDEYAAAGLKSLPVQRGEEASRLQLLGYTVALVPVTLLPSLLGIAGLFYGLLALGLGSIALGMAIHGALAKLGKPWARRVFRFSLLHLAILFAGLWIDVGLRR